jgi:nucleobase:cation symporter-1, NCS1 family
MSHDQHSPPAATPREGGTLGMEHRSIDWVPLEERHGKVWHQSLLWFLGNFQYFTVAVGFVGPALGLALVPTIVAGVLGIMVGTLFMAFHATQGPVLGLPQMIQSRAQLGYRGVTVALAATLFTYVGFNIACLLLVSQGLHDVFGLNPTTVSVGATLIALVLAVYGHDWLHRVFRWLLYLSLPLVLLLTVGVMIGHAGGHASVQHYAFAWPAFFAQFSASAAYNITYAPYVSDYSRYLPRTTSSRSLIGAVFFGASGSAAWLIALGAWLAIRLGVSDGLVGLHEAGNHFLPGLGTATAVMSVLAMVATMGMNAYGASLTVLTGLSSFRRIALGRRARIVTVVGLAVLWYAVASAISASAVATVFTALTIMLYLLVPWTASNLVDFFFVRRGHYVISELFNPHGCYGVWAWRGLTAYFVGLAAEVPFMVIPGLAGWSYTGPAAQLLGGTDVAWVIGLAVTSVTYFALARRPSAATDVPVSVTRARRSAEPAGDGVVG